MEAEGINDQVEILRVETDEEAERLRYIGSPTIIVNGSDIDPPETPQYAVTCRAYRVEDGRVSPLPPEQMIRNALRNAKTKES